MSATRPLPALHAALFGLSLLALPTASGCSETVGFLDLELTSPSFDPPLVCADDPRRVARVRLALRCGDTVLEREASVDESAALSGVPLGGCSLEVEGRNAQGRTVLSGARSLQLDSGDNAPVTLQLVEERCDASCDQDSDGLADSDERALGLDPTATDTDLDGVDDGFELMHCCSDPLADDGKSCKLGIQEVLPRVGAPGETVLLKTSQLVQDAQVQLGGAALQLFFTDPSTLLLGSISAQAVLGDVEASAGGQTARWGLLYAVVRQRPELVVELDREAGALGALIAQVVDLASSGDVLYLLGVSGSSGPNGVITVPVLLRYNQVSGAKQRVLVPVNGVKPLGLAVRDGRVAALAASATSTVLVSLLESQLGGATPPKPAVRTLDAPGANALLLEPGGRFAQVLARNGILRVDLDGPSAALRPTPLPAQVPGPAPGAPPTAHYACGGLAHRAGAGGGYTYLSCTASCDAASPAGSPGTPTCQTRPLLLRVGPLDTCLKTSVSPGSCWTTYVAPGGGDSKALGSPAVDAKAQRVYLLSNTLGVLFAPFAGPPQPQPLLSSLATLQLATNAGSPHPMVVDEGRRVLYLADGPHVQRLELDGATPRPRPFSVGNAAQETAELLTLVGKGSLLAVLRSIGGQAPALLGVCIERCPNCPCAPPAPGP